MTTIKTKTDYDAACALASKEANTEIIRLGASAPFKPHQVHTFLRYCEDIITCCYDSTDYINYEGVRPRRWLIKTHVS